MSDDNATGVGLDEFLKHSNRSNKSNYLKWRDKGIAKVWIHPQTWSRAPRDEEGRPKVGLWNHRWFRVIEVENDGEKEQKVVGSRFVSHEPEKTLKKQYFRDDDGEREHPPVVCPMSFLTDWVYRAIEAGEIDWTTPIFQFEGDDPDEAVVLHAGGIVGMFNARDLSKEQKQQLKKAGISPRDSWKENLMARCQYLFLVVDDEEPDAGILKATEADSIGKGMRKAMKEEMIRKGRDKGNPMVRPYPFQWTYDEDKQPNEKYAVIALEDEPRQEIRALLKEEAPDISEDYEPGDCVLLRAEMEAHACEGVTIPFDEIFAAAKKAGLMKPKESAAKKPKTDEKEAAAKDDDGKIGCDFCLSELADDDVFCDSCGASYDEQSYQLDGLPCLSEKCKGKKQTVSIVPSEKNAKTDAGQARFVCEKCAAIHELRSGDEPVAKRWSLVKAAPKEEPKKDPPKAAAKGGRRAARAAAPTGKPFKSSDDGDDFPKSWG